VTVVAPAQGAARARAARTKARERARARARRGLLSPAAMWVMLLAALFGGIVALNVGAMRGTIAANRTEAEARAIRADNARVAAEVAELSGFFRVTQRAKELGMEPAQPLRRDYIRLQPGKSGPAKAADTRPAVPK
jgi:hypothetical protein